MQFAPSAYLASAARSADLIRHILPLRFQKATAPLRDEAIAIWANSHDEAPPDISASHQQRACCVKATATPLLENAPDSKTRARLLAASTKESGAWLSALPISSLGLRMDDDTIRVAVGLRLGSSLCNPHQCQHCGAEVDSQATHGLSCRYSEGRHHRHAELNQIIYRSLISARIPSRLEPSD